MSHVTFLEQGILSEMFPFKLLTKLEKVTLGDLPLVNIKSEALNAFLFLLKNAL